MKKNLWCALLFCLVAACSPATLSSVAVESVPHVEPAAEEFPLEVVPIADLSLSDTPTPVPTFTPTPAPTAAPTVAAVLVPTLAPTPTATATSAPRPTRVYWGREVRVPILMYHHIAVPPANADAIRLDLSVWPEHFEQQMAYFASQGYHAVKLADLYDAVMKSTPLPDKPIVFTFDDGYDDNYLNALPILQKYNFIGTFYIPTGLINRPGYMTWEQVGALGKAGMDVQSHSVTHPSLKGKSLAFLRKELGESKQTLEALLGKPVLFFCYPAGQYDALTIQVLQELGYLSATTTQPGARLSESAMYEWPRVRVRGADRVGDLVGRINLSLYGRTNP